MLHYRDHPDLVAVILKLANADIRAAKGEAINIPGIEVKTERKL